MTIYYKQKSIEELIAEKNQGPNFATVKKMILSQNWQTICLVLFLIANTSFLVYEQMNFYLAKNYSFGESFFYSLLMEAGIIFLSLTSAHQASWQLRWISKALLVCSVFVVAMMIRGSVDQKISAQETSSLVAHQLDDQMEGLKEIGMIHRRNLEKIDPLQHKTKHQHVLDLVEKNQVQMNVILEKRLQMIATDDVQLHTEASALVGMRYLALLWNLLFSYLLGRRRVRE